MTEQEFLQETIRQQRERILELEFTLKGMQDRLVAMGYRLADSARVAGELLQVIHEKGYQ